MGAWATASLLIMNIVWIENYANSQQLGQPPANYGSYQQQVGRFYVPSETNVTAHSALSLYPQSNLAPSSTRFPARKIRFDNNHRFGKAFPFYENFEKIYKDNMIKINKTKVAVAEDRHSVVDHVLPSVLGYDDYKTSQATQILGPQIETIESQHFHKTVPALDISNYHHQPAENHGEIHYHQHKHIHKHEHKQEHVHQHKQDHQHKHVHSQQHKHQHEHRSQHGHQHKHNHHQQHKHDHHHKHDNRHEHKHGHQHGHKHQHHSDNKHQHNHKHGHKRHGHK